MSTQPTHDIQDERYCRCNNCGPNCLCDTCTCATCQCPTCHHAEN